MTLRLRFTTDLEAKARRTSERAAAAIFLQLNNRFQAALASAVFEWPNQTTRSNGQVVGSPRNAVDTGLLRQSNTAPEINGLRVRYTWRTPYATAVHEGAQLVNGTILPPRPWTSAVLGSERIDGIEPIDRAALKDVWLKAFRQS
ncbi:MAG: hypothetical protein KME02_12820 [Aphanothece saxicola GSE-SYN-MK-01-06B]|jgi:hypothetical protein|nr:hypothetical protein [Aphanothece saxicola GSE-SYN-MK-01-06B]